MMRLKACMLAMFMLVGLGSTMAQDLKNLRVLPDTTFIEGQERKPLSIRDINVPIPKLDLSVNYWKHWTKFGVNLNQASFSDNWNAGGVNSLAWSSTAWHKSEYNKGNFQFVTEVDLRYGKIKNKDQIAKKNNDRIFWDNKLSYRLSSSWALYTSLTFESQFDAGYRYTRVDGEEVVDTIISAFMAPGYFTESFGLEYKPDNTFSVRFGTGTARQTLVLDHRMPLGSDGTRFGVEDGKNVRNDLAFQLTANLDRNLSKNLNLKSRYNLFADYKDLGDPDHRLDITLTAKVTSLVNVTVNGIMLYDSDVDPKVQYSQALALGILFSFPR